MSLDKLNHDASINTESELQYVSICLGGRPDDAREVIEQPSIPRWDSIDGHYHMDFDSKEIMKQLLNFKTVPFYVVFDHTGKLHISGTKLDLDTIPNRRRCVQSVAVTSSCSYSSKLNNNNSAITALNTYTRDIVDQCPVPEPIASDSESSNTSYDDDLSISSKLSNSRSTSPTRVFEIEDLNF
jgi:hypothetical protein